MRPAHSSSSPRRERLAQHGARARTPIRGLDHAARQLRQHGFHGDALAAPPTGQRWQRQFLAQQVAGDRRQKSQQGGRLEKAGTRRIGDEDVARADRLQQAGHAQVRVGPQLERVQEFVVQPLEDAVHRLQAVQRLEVQALVAHREIAAFHQGQAQVAGQVGVLEIGLVVRARGEQHDARLALAGAHAAQSLDQGPVGGGQPLHLEVAEGLGEEARDDQPVFQQVAQARRGLRALRQHPPGAGRVARQVEGGDVQMRSARGPHAVQGAQVAGVALHEGRRQQVLGQQLLRPVHVRHDAIEQLDPLQHAGFDLAPAARRDDQRKQIQRPRPLRAAGIGVHVVADAVVAHLALQIDGAAIQVVEAVPSEVLEEAGPGPQRQAMQGSARGAVPTSRGRRRHRATQFVVMTGRGRRRQCRCQRRGRFLGIGPKQRIGGLVVCVHGRDCHTGASGRPGAACRRWVVC